MSRNPPGEVLHGDEVAALGEPEFVDLHHVGVEQLRRQPRLVAKHVDDFRHVREVSQQPLDHHVLLEAVHASQLGEEYLGHSAFGQLLDEVVLVERPQRESAFAGPPLKILSGDRVHWQCSSNL